MLAKPLGWLFSLNINPLNASKVQVGFYFLSWVQGVCAGLVGCGVCLTTQILRHQYDILLLSAKQNVLGHMLPVISLATVRKEKA